ncbi:hypothetical protein [Streptomyces prunicolor]|uniref:hypothetical protein n=1 Tax=Streptomyces prunicolor TaxID=67348 RepID=UPI0033CED3F8
MTQDSTAAQRSIANQLKHLQERQSAHAKNGPKGIAAAWYDRARSVATKRERAGDPEAWNQLARALENWCGSWDPDNAQ